MPVTGPGITIVMLRYWLTPPHVPKGGHFPNFCYSVRVISPSLDLWKRSEGDEIEPLRGGGIGRDKECPGSINLSWHCLRASTCQGQSHVKNGHKWEKLGMKKSRSRCESGVILCPSVHFLGIHERIHKNLKLNWQSRNADATKTGKMHNVVIFTGQIASLILVGVKSGNPKY